MTDTMECMCQDCGISSYFQVTDLSYDEPGPGGRRLVQNLFCPQCGGQLFLVGRAGDEPTYRTG